LTFAAQLLLLVVLLGRDRVRRFPLFSAGLALYAMRLLVEVLLAGRMAMIPLDEILLSLADLGAILTLLVLVEVARRAFGGLGWRGWTTGAVALAAVTGLAEWAWGGWPEWKQMADHSLIGMLRLMQFAAQKMDLATDVLTVGLTLLIVAFGRRYTGGWRTHAQKLAIGLGTTSAAWLGVQQLWLAIARSAHPHNQEEYEHLMDLGGRLANANKAVYLLVLLWWIAWMWREESGAAVAAAEEAQPAQSEAPALEAGQGSNLDD
jgi:peptidoglycan biosynthesis protein MviN/MurJ (putative lipid II flippase)